MKPKPYVPRLHPGSNIISLCASRLLDDLTHAELLVYLRLLDASSHHGRRAMSIRNADLHRDARQAARALPRLQSRGLVRLVYDRRNPADRIVELL